MTTIVNNQTIFDGERKAIIKCYMYASDANGETNVVKIDPSTLNKSASGQSCTSVIISRLTGIAHGLEVQLLWDATSPVQIEMLPTDTQYTQDYSEFGGLINNAGAGKTGKILATTYDTTTGDSYTLVFELIKQYG